MQTRKTLSFATPEGIREQECIFFKVKFNHFRDVGSSAAPECRDREEMAECECVLCLPDSYASEGAPTPLVLAFHGAGGKVCEAENKTGGVSLAMRCLQAGYAVLDVCGSEPHGTTMGCPEHVFAAYKAYRYVIRQFNLEDRVLVTGASMGGHVAMNFVNTFPSIALAVGIFCPRLHMDGVTVNGHYCIGTWDKTESKNGAPSTRERIIDIFRFKGSEWSDETTIGFNPHRTRSFINADGERVIMPPCPIKIWQGTIDPTVDCVMVEEYIRAVRRGGCYCELHLMDGVVHEVTPVMKQELLYWFNRFID